ncbi:MAG: MarR family transcriptional regulator [Candidatus Altiarchaeota archaeon]
MEVSETRLAAAIIAVFSLGILLSILNGYYVEDTGSSMPVLTYAVAGLSMGIGALIILLFQWRIKQNQVLRILKVLPQDERVILELLLREKKMDQTHIVAESGLSKVRVSRTISRLEARGVVEKKPLGNTNLIKIGI